MDRKEFLRTCAGGACACMAACVAPAAADAPAPEDWKLPFVKKRYARLIELLAGRMDEHELGALLHDLGAFCSSQGQAHLDKYRGDVEGYAAFIRSSASGDIVTYDRERRVITMSTDERPDCFCPLNGVAYKTPGVVCDCSLGWQENTWQAVLQRKVRVELKEAVLRGGKHCTFEIHVLDEPLGHA